MKTLVIGLDCAAGELLFGDPELVNLRRLMEAGCYGSLRSVIPPITVPAWMCMATSQDPGCLGVYGFRNRASYDYHALETVNSRSIRQLAIWDQMALEGKKATIVGVPPNYPARRTSGVSVGCFLTPDPATNVFTHPAELSPWIRNAMGGYPVDVKGFRTENKDWLKDEIFKMSRRQFAIVRHLLRETEWDYFQFVDIGLDRMHHGFWKYCDPRHRQYEDGNPHEHVIRDYYRHLDDQIGQILEMLDDETAVLVMSDHGAKRLDGGFCVNEWLIDEGLLVLKQYPDKITRFDQLDVDWEKTTAWSEGGYYARLFLNVEGREPHGTIPKSRCEAVRQEIRAKLEALCDDRGEPMGTRVFKPEETYRELRNIPPDLIVFFGDLLWRSIGSVGHRRWHVQENDTGPDDCNHSLEGVFVLAAPGGGLSGEIEGASLLEMAPTLLELSGCDVPPSMLGQSLLGSPAAAAVGLTPSEEVIVRNRLQGLGYI